MTPGCLLIADSKLVILLESGELVIAEAKTTGYKELTRRQILGTGCHYPAISEGKLYARDDKKIVSFKAKLIVSIPLMNVTTNDACTLT